MLCIFENLFKADVSGDEKMYILELQCTQYWYELTSVQPWSNRKWRLCTFELFKSVFWSILEPLRSGKQNMTGKSKHPLSHCGVPDAIFPPDPLQQTASYIVCIITDFSWSDSCDYCICAMAGRYQMHQLSRHHQCITSGAGVHHQIMIRRLLLAWCTILRSVGVKLKNLFTLYNTARCEHVSCTLPITALLIFRTILLEARRCP